MTTMQQTILKAIDDKMDPYPYTLDFQYNNIGFIRALDPATLAAKRSLHFDFQNGYVIVKDGPEYIARHWYGQERTTLNAPDVTSTPMELVDAVVAYLKGKT